MNENGSKEIKIHKKLNKQLESLKKENRKLYAKVLAGIQSLSEYRAEDNGLVTKSIGDKLYELKVDGYNKFIRVFYTEDKQTVYCLELLEKKTNKIPKGILKRLDKWRCLLIGNLHSSCFKEYGRKNR